MITKIFLSLLLILAFNSIANAQSAESITQSISELGTNSTLTEETRTKAIAILEDAKQHALAASERTVLVRGYEATALTSAATIAQLRKDLEQLANQPIAEQSFAKDDAELNASIADLSAEHTTLVDLLDTLRSRQTNLTSRATAIAKEIAEARSDVEDMQSAPPAQVSSTDPIASANITLFSVRLAERQAAIGDLSRERSTIAARQAVLEARINFANARSERITALVEELQKHLGTSKTVTAADWVDAAKEQLADLPDKHPALTAFAQENISLAQTNLELIERNISIAAETRRLKQDLVQITASTQTVDQVLATGQLNDDTAELLRNVRERLPKNAQLDKATVASTQAGVALRLNLILWQDRLRVLSNSRKERAALLVESGEQGSQQSVTGIAENLIDQRLTYLQALISAARENVAEISDQLSVRQNVQERIAALTALLDRRLLWLPTKSGFSSGFWKNISSNATWLASGAGWRETLRSLVSSFTTFKPGPTVLILLAVIIALFSKVIRPYMLVLADRVGNVRKDTYLTTPIALILSLVYTLPLPLAIGAVGLAIAQGSETSFALAISLGLYSMAGAVLILGFIDTLASRNGVFDRHFGWSELSLSKLRLNLKWFLVVEAIVAFMFTAAVSSGDLVIKYGLGSLAFIASSIAIAVFSFNFLNPRNGIVMSISGERKFTGALGFLFVLLVATPLIIGLLPVAGYFEAAVALQSRVFESGIVLLSAAVVYWLSLRFFLVGHRRLALQRAEEKRERAKAMRAENSESEQSGDASPTMSVDTKSTLDSLSKRSKRAVVLISAFVLLLGLWTTWSAMIPALGIADDVILWNGIHNVDGIAVATGISLWDLTVALFLIFGGIFVAKNVAGLFELVVFERMELESGTQYAVITIGKYVLVSVGIVVGLSRLGLDWSSLQWVIAALGVGLGFGLQEIVANFVSGLIILFERPVRVGDIVTIGELEGTVTGIQIRATRITDFDNREVLMPNKSIITENVTNWTLNDQVTRIIIRIGVAYGSDVDQVREIILQAVTDHVDTLSAPSPAVFFLSHGDSSLNFEARVFVATPSKRLPVTHDLNRSINLALSDNGIQIPFPQRDLHIKTDGKD